jgi:3-oxoadipate enol-lactonase
MTLNHRFDGPAEAPVLVLSNSLATDLTAWSANLPAWTSSFRVLRYDQRGHGGSEVPPGPYSLELLGRDVLELLDAAAVDRASFCGLSLGGATGMWVAVNAPNRIERLVLACTSPRFGEPEQWLDRARIVRSEGLEAIADALLGRWFTPRFHREREAVVRRYRAALVGTSAEGYAACCDALAAWDFRDQVGEIAAPTLVIAAAEDPTVPPEQAAQLADAIGGSRLVVLESAAHLANVEQPEAFSAAVSEHLALQEAA